MSSSSAFCLPSSRSASGREATSGSRSLACTSSYLSSIWSSRSSMVVLGCRNAAITKFSMPNAAPHVQRRVPVDRPGLEGVSPLVGGDRLVLRPVVLVHAPDVGDKGDQQDVAEEEPDADPALDQVLADRGADPDEAAPELPRQGGN